MTRAHLVDTTRAELRSLRCKLLPHKVRDRVVILLLADAGWSALQIAAPCDQTVRGLLKDFLGPAPNTDCRDRVTEELKLSLARDRIWTSRQLSEALAARGIEVRPFQLLGDLRRMRIGYRRTASTFEHKQTLVKSEWSGETLVNLKANVSAGSVMLYTLDECGFSPTLQVVDCWTLPGLRKFFRYEAPQCRRVNAIWSSYLIGFLKSLPWSNAPRVVVLDNARFHITKVIRKAYKGLACENICMHLAEDPVAVLAGVEPARADFPPGQASRDPRGEPHYQQEPEIDGLGGFNNYSHILSLNSRRQLGSAA